MTATAYPHRPSPREAEEREARTDAFLAGGFVALALAALWLLAPTLEGTGFWGDHFAGASVRGLLPFLAFFAVPAALVRALWPRTWESELLSRGLRRLAAAVFLWWMFATALDAPSMAAALVAPVLAGPLVTAAGLAWRGRLGADAWSGITLSALGVVLLLVFLLAVHTFWLWLVAIVLPLVAYTLGAPLGLRRARRRAPERVAPFLDLPLGTLVPPGGWWGLATTAFLVLFTALVVAPGVPVRTLVLWTPFALAVPFLVRGVLRLGGVAQPKALAGPVEARRHDEVVHHLPDETLERLDLHVARFARTGYGRKALARTLAGLLATTAPDITEEHLLARLATLPRGRRHKRTRTQALHRMLAAGFEERPVAVRTNGGRGG